MTHRGNEPSPRVTCSDIWHLKSYCSSVWGICTSYHAISGSSENKPAAVKIFDSPRRRSSPSSRCLRPSSPSLAMPRYAGHWIERQIRYNGAWQHLVFDFGGALPLRAADLGPDAQERTCVAAACDTFVDSFGCAAGDVACNVSAGHLLRGAKCGLLYSTRPCSCRRSRHRAFRPMIGFSQNTMHARPSHNARSDVVGPPALDGGILVQRRRGPSCRLAP